MKLFQISYMHVLYGDTVAQKDLRWISISLGVLKYVFIWIFCVWVLHHVWVRLFIVVIGSQDLVKDKQFVYN